MANYGRSMSGGRRRRGRRRTTRRASGMAGGLPRRQSRTRSRRNPNMLTGGTMRRQGGGRNLVSMLPDLPPKGNFRHIVREGTTGKKATLFACPHPRKTEDCVKLNEHQRKIISNGDPYSGV
tara:strand:- start:149 stop:514 length:366 start_codon:yes stop_codon:yes gene_type:complete